LPDASNAVADALQRHPDADIYVFGCDLLDEHDHAWPGYRPETYEVFECGDGFLKFASGVHARMPGVLFKHDFLKCIGAFDERFELTAADSDLVQRALLLGRSVFIPEVIGLYRIWRGSLTHARQATDLWMKEVGLWTDKISELLSKGHQPPSRRVDIDRYKDEIIAQNLLAGFRNLQSKGLMDDAHAFLARNPVPRRARLMTHLRLMRCRWALWSAAN
jgi:hypothetical protein